MSFGRRLEQLLNERVRTRSWLAGCLQVNPAEVDSWCSDASLPDAEALQAIATALAVTLDSLVPKEAPVHRRRRRTLHQTQRFFRRTRL